MFLVTGNRVLRKRRFFPSNSLEVNVGETRTFYAPTGYVGTIYIQRDGVDIPGAVSAPESNYYVYTFVSADAGKTLTPRIPDLVLDTVAPRRHGMSVTVAEPNIILVEFNKSLGQGAVSAAQFAVAGTVATAKTVIGVTQNNNFLRIQVSSNYVPGDAPTLAYTQSGTSGERVKDWTGNDAASWSAEPVFNEYEGPATAATLITTSGLMVVGGGGFVLSPGGNAGFSHQLTQAAFANSAHQAIMVNNGWVESQATDTDAATRIVALKSTEVGGNALSQLTYNYRFTNGTVRPYQGNTAVGSLYTFPGTGTNHRMRLYRNMPDGVITLETSADGGINWAVRHTFSTPTDPEISLQSYVNSNSETVAVVGVALFGFESRGF